MLFKLLIVRVDNFTVEKLNLQIGNNIIGRGAATGHVDNQIAEQAVTINLALTGEMSMTPMKACYMKSSGSNRWQSLKVGSTVVIRPGDICSLLPDRSWFKIISTDESVMDKDNDINGKRKSAEPSKEPRHKKLRSESGVETIYSQNAEVLDRWNAVVERSDDNSSSNNTNDVTDDPSAAKNTHSLSARDGSSSVDGTPSDSNDTGTTVVSAPAEVSDKKTTAEASTGSTDTKETSSSGNRDDAEKKIKWDCGRHFSDQTDQQTDETAEELGQGLAAAENNSPAAAEAAEEPARNKCTYGSQCYRRNSSHRARFSHPGDPDYDTPDPRPECPYGVRCYRKNPQHKRDFKHTKNRRSRAQTPVRAQAPDETSGTDHSSAEESVDESEYEPSLYDGTSDDYLSEYDDKSDLDGTSDCDDK